MISENDVRVALKEVAKSPVVDEWSLDYDFLDGALDSLDHATFALLLEERHGLNIPDDDLPGLNTIAAVLGYANNKAAGNG